MMLSIDSDTYTLEGIRANGAQRLGWLQVRLLQAVGESDLNWSRIAAALNTDKGSLSRFLNHDGKLSRHQVEVMLDMVGLDVAGRSDGMVTIPEGEYRALVTLVHIATNDHKRGGPGNA